ARQARIPRAVAMCVLPVPGGPSRMTFSRAWRKSSWPRCSITVFLTERWKVKSNSLSVLRAGDRAVLIRPSPPWLSGAVAFGAQGRFGELLIAPGLSASPVSHRRECASGRGGFERAEQVREL